MEHHFDVEIATKFNITVSLILNCLIKSEKIERITDKSFNILMISLNYLCIYFPYLSKNKICRSLNIIKKNNLFSFNLNKDI